MFTMVLHRTLPRAAFVVCSPTFERFDAKVTIDSHTEAVLSSEIIATPTPIAGVTDLTSQYQPNGTTISAAFGSAFLLRTLFEYERKFESGHYNLDMWSDASTAIEVNVLRNKSLLSNGDNLLQSVEKSFSVRRNSSLRGHSCSSFGCMIPN